MVSQGERQVAPGEKAYCPVSGVVFEVKKDGARRSVGDRTFFFCCESCANFFSENQARVLSARTRSRSVGNE